MFWWKLHVIFSRALFCTITVHTCPSSALSTNLLKRMATGVGQPDGNRRQQEVKKNDRQRQPPTGTPSGGFDCKFVERPSNDVLQVECPVCLLVLREPNEVTCCGNSFCQICIQRVQAAENQCPTCSQEFTTFHNKDLKRELYVQKVYCSKSSLGCEWKGELGKLDIHLNLQPPPEKQVEGCQFSEVECSLCLQPFQRRYLQPHQSDDCPKRPFSCQLCNQHEATFEKITQSHLPVCPSFHFPCPSNCDLVLQRQELENHITEDCPLTIIDCDFCIVGCWVSLPRKDMPRHISDYLGGHMSLLQAHTAAHLKENMYPYIGLIVGTLQKIVIDNALMHNQLCEANKELQKSHLQQHKLHMLYENLQKSHDKLHESHKKLNESHDKLFESYQKLHKSHALQHESCDYLYNSQGEMPRKAKQSEENIKLASRHDSSQEHITKPETAMIGHTTYLEEQENIIDTSIVQSDKMAFQHICRLQKFQESLVQQKDELMTVLDASEENLDKPLAATKNEFQTSLATAEEKLQVSLVTREELQDSPPIQQTIITECNNDSKRLRQRVTEDEEKHHKKEIKLLNMIDQSNAELVKKMKAIEDQLQVSLATQQATILAKCRNLETSAGKLQASLAMQQIEWTDKNRRLKQAISEQERKQSEREDKMKKIADEKTSEMTEKIRAIENKLHISLAAQQTTILAICSDENKQLLHAITEQERKRQENEAILMALKEDFSNKIAASEQNIYAQQTTLTLHQQTLERVTCTGKLPFHFIMNEFKSKKENDVEWYSPPFYTHTHGYKMCIRVNANGYWRGKGTHISVSVFVMKGPYDDDLLWPFQGAVTIQLLNQLEDSNHHAHTIDFIETTHPTVINKVISGKKADIGWGTHIFLPHTRLNFNSKINCQYLKYDQLNFRVSKAANIDLTSHIHRQCLKLENFSRAIEPQVAMVPIEFSISNFEHQKNQESIWISPGFYTHKRGYRMCLLVYPNGNTDGRGTYVSIYICLMRGTFDSLLKWPFRGDVVIQIVDQAGKKHHDLAIEYNYYTPDSYARRVIDRERTDGWGSHAFLPHTSLGYNIATNAEYLQADSLRIGITKVRIKN